MPHNQNSGLVYEGEGCEIAGVDTSSFEDNAELVTESIKEEWASVISTIRSWGGYGVPYVPERKRKTILGNGRVS